MAKPFLLRVGIAQILANPAYADELVSSIQEPTFPDGNEKVGLFSIAGLEPINALRLNIAETYINHLSRKLDAVIRFASAAGVELLLFPEYSIPAECLPLCRTLSEELKIPIIAGSHVVTLSAAAQQVYRALGLVSIDTARTLSLDDKVKQAVCIVFIPGESIRVFPKYVKSKWEACLISGSPALHSFDLNTRGGKVEVQVLICIEALSEQQFAREKHTHARLITIPAFSPTRDDFYQFAKLSLLQGKCTLFANVGEFGGSKGFARAEKATYWFSDKDGTAEVPQHAEALIVMEADLEKQFEIRRSSVEHAALTDVKAFPLLYEMGSPEPRQYIDIVKDCATSLDLAEIGRRVEPFTTLSDRVFPKFLQEKLRHFVSHVVPSGTATSQEAMNWIRPLTVADAPSTDYVRWNLCNKAIATVNELMMSGGYVTKTKSLLDVYAYLMTKRNELAEFVQPPDNAEETEQKPGSISVQAPSPDIPAFFDREHAHDKIRAFVNQSTERAFVLKGMRGIGKTSLVQEAFRQAIPRTTKRIWLQLTEGTSHPRLLAELAYACNLQIAEGITLVDSATLMQLEQRLISYLSQNSNLVIIFDEFQFLLNTSGEIEDTGIRNLLLKMVSVAEKSKYFFISHLNPKLPPELESVCSHYHLQGLVAKDTQRLLQHWFQASGEMPPGGLPVPSERFLSFLGGHPLAAKVAARLWAEHPSQELVDDLSIFKELRDTIVTFILGRLKTTPPEADLLSFASVFRLPAPREVFTRWRGEEANFLLNSLTSQYLIESSEKGYQLHPLVRDFYYSGTSPKRAVEFHRTAAKFYIESFETLRKTTKELNPEHLGEAIHHFLAAGDKRRVQDLAFYRQELKPVALTHYRRREYKMALADYKVLVDLDRNDADAHLHLALIYGRQKQWGDAELHFGQAQTLRPDAYWIMQGFGAVLLDGNRIEEAKHLLHRAEEVNPYSSATLISLGRLYERERDDPSAEYYFRRALEMDRNSSFAYYSLARLLYRQGDIRNAYDMACAALATKPLDDRNKALVSELKDRVERSEASPAQNTEQARA